MSSQVTATPRSAAAVWISRLCIGLVLIWNLQAALTFIIWPAEQVPSFELSVEIGAAIIRSVGILFLMWNVPYAVAVWHPVRHRLSLYEAIVMQAIGVVGETWVFLATPASHVAARSSLARFMGFDSAGLVLLLIAAWISRKQ